MLYLRACEFARLGTHMPSISSTISSTCRPHLSSKGSSTPPASSLAYACISPPCALSAFPSFNDPHRHSLLCSLRSSVRISKVSSTSLSCVARRSHCTLAFSLPYLNSRALFASLWLCSGLGASPTSVALLMHSLGSIGHRGGQASSTASAWT